MTDDADATAEIAAFAAEARALFTTAGVAEAVADGARADLIVVAAENDDGPAAPGATGPTTRPASRVVLGVTTHQPHQPHRTERSWN